ncbi:putative mediator of RNA polymerase II transcription subunit [Clavispora lusitaniae]|uniref:Mediator of RNA polymerase II transcription subunit 8 n=1 Tax=Clavispora lusitaniae TaxID=36911 RepID=A0AA91Q263_CLALS|nr:putative mediator of RNA polymerase II transcription subunit [Clavispora lusitaniae]
MDKQQTPPSQVPVDSLELIRNRLSQVHQSLRKLADQINHTNRNPRSRLPGYSNLQSQFHVLITQLHTIASQLDTNDEILRASTAYPLPSFPTTQHEGLVTTLLRKKPLPEVDEWIESAIAESATFKMPIQKDDSFAEWCYSKVKELEESFNFEGFYTEAELAHLESEEGKKEQSEKEAIAKEKEQAEKRIVGTEAPMSSNQVLRFMHRGIV